MLRTDMFMETWPAIDSRAQKDAKPIQWTQFVLCNTFKCLQLGSKT